MNWFARKPAQASRPKWSPEKVIQQAWRRLVFERYGYDPIPLSTDEMYAGFELPPHLQDRERVV